MSDLILIVEDEPKLAALVRDYLQAAGYRSEWLADGRQVRERGKTGPRPAAVLLDVSPPEYPGLEVLAQMRSHPVTHAVPVVVLAPADDAAVVARSYEMGANSVLLKTADATRLAEMLRRMQAYWLQINETV